MNQTSLELPIKIILDAPVNQRAKILRKIIVSDGANERQFCYNGFRMRISEIRDLLKEENIELRFALIPFINEFNERNKFRHHFILDCDKPAAVEVYKKINKG